MLNTTFAEIIKAKSNSLGTMKDLIKALLAYHTQSGDMITLPSAAADLINEGLLTWERPAHNVVDKIYLKLSEPLAAAAREAALNHLYETEDDDFVGRELISKLNLQDASSMGVDSIASWLAPFVVLCRGLRPVHVLQRRVPKLAMSSWMFRAPPWCETYTCLHLILSTSTSRLASKPLVRRCLQYRA